MLTAAHHVRSEGVTVSFAEERSATAELVGVDRDLGVALLEVDTGEIEPLAWAPADAEVGIGTAVVALANPGGRGLRASLGFVAAADRGFRGPARPAGLGRDRAHGDAAARLGRRALCSTPTAACSASTRCGSRAG